LIEQRAQPAHRHRIPFSRGLLGAHALHPLHAAEPLDQVVHARQRVVAARRALGLVFIQAGAEPAEGEVPAALAQHGPLGVELVGPEATSASEMPCTAAAAGSIRPAGRTSAESSSTITRSRTRTAAISTTSARSTALVVVSMSTTVKSRNAERALAHARSWSALNSASGRPS